jgi:hypothetical protein
MHPVHALIGCDVVACCYNLGEINNSESVKKLDHIHLHYLDWLTHLVNLSCDRSSCSGDHAMNAVQVNMSETRFWKLAIGIQQKRHFRELETSSHSHLSR